MAKQNNLIHVFQTYYLFYHKELGNTKVYTTDDVPAEEIKERYQIHEESVFKGIFNAQTNQFITLNLVKIPVLNLADEEIKLNK